MLSKFETDSESHEHLKIPVVLASCFCSKPLELSSEQNRHGLCPDDTYSEEEIITLSLLLNK